MQNSINNSIKNILKSKAALRINIKHRKSSILRGGYRMESMLYIQFYSISGRTRKQRRMQWEFAKALFGLLPDPLSFSWKFFRLSLNDPLTLIYGFEPLSHLQNFSNIYLLPSDTSQPSIYLTELHSFTHEQKYHHQHHLLSLVLIRPNAEAAR